MCRPVWWWWLWFLEPNIQFIIKTQKSQFKKAAPLHLQMWSAEPEDSAIINTHLLVLPLSNHVQITPGCFRITPYTSVQIRLIGYNLAFCSLCRRCQIKAAHHSWVLLFPFQISFFAKMAFHVLFLKCIIMLTLLYFFKSFFFAINHCKNVLKTYTTSSILLHVCSHHAPSAPSR